MIPLHAAVLCLDCELVYELRHDSARALCPRCASRSRVALVSWLDGHEDRRWRESLTSGV